MTKTAWYDTLATDQPKSKSVQCETYACVLSLKELEDIRVACPYEITKLSYWIKNRNGEICFEGSHSFEGNGVTEFMLKDAVSLSDFAPYETENTDYFLETGVTLSDGTELSGFRIVKYFIRKGTSTKDLPQYDLLEKLNAIPIANSDMTEEELRKICVDFMKLQCEFPYKFNADCYYTVASQNKKRHLLPETVYGGIPYVTAGAGSLYRLAEFFDPATGTIDLSGDIFNDALTYGNACSGAACMAWSRVVSSAYMGYCKNMTPISGFLPVGPYRYSQPEIVSFAKKKLNPDGYGTHDICCENGEQVMFESYGQMKPADGIVVSGHVRMNTAIPTVVRKADGTIDGEQSYALMTEQVCFVSDTNHIRIAPDGTHYTAQGLVDRKYTFRELFETDYLPVTFAEFSDPSCVKKSYVRALADATPIKTILSSNYTISDIFLETESGRYVYRFTEFCRKEVKLCEVFSKEILHGKIKASVRLFNGETHTVLLG